MEENEKIWSFCEVDFLKSLFNEKLEQTDDQFEYWYELFRFLRDKSTLIIDSTEKFGEFALDNPYMKNIIKNSNTGGSRIIENKGYFEGLRVDLAEHIKHCSSVNPLFFFSKQPDMRSNWGVEISYYGEHYNTIKKVALSAFTLSASRIEKRANQLKSWNDILSQMPACNSLIISDNYFLGDTDYKQNIHGILNGIIPKELDNTFDLMVIVKPGLDKYDAKVKVIEEIVRQFQVEVNLTITQSDYHSRALISNYVYIQSDHSFSMFNKDGSIKKDSLISYKPIGSEHNIDWFTKKLLEIKKVVQRGMRTIGSGRNRLIDDL
jgi:hypothetical protein